MREKKARSLREVIASVSESKIIDRQEFVDVSVMSDSERLAYVGTDKRKAVCSYYLLSRKEESLYFAHKQEILHRVGRKTFIKRENLGNAYIDSKSVRSSLTSESLLVFLKELGIDWLERFNNKYMVLNIVSKNKTLFKMLLCGSIYSEETFYKAWAKVSYKLDRIDWKLFKNFQFCNDYCRPSIFDLKDFTDNVVASMDAYVNRANDRQLMSDLVKDAIMLDKKVNLRWSTRRATEEHLHNIRLIRKAQIEAMNQTPIFDEVVEEPSIHLLNSEREVYNEGMVMNHCIYLHYFKSIRKHTYLGFHMTSPEDCTFGVRLDNNDLILDQIYLSHDRCVRDETREKAVDFIKRNEKKLRSLLNVDANDSESVLPF